MLDDYNVLYRIASLYYEQKLRQEDIATQMGMSRPMISRALAKALEVGIVQISVVPPADFRDTEKKLASALKIRKAVIAPTVSSTGNDYNDRLSDVSDFAARYLEKNVSGNMNIGIGWGVTVYNTIMKLRQRPDSGSEPKFVPLVGSIGSTQSEYQESVMVNAAASRFNGQAYYYNVSMLLIKNKEEFADLKIRYKAIYDIWKDLDMAVFGLGSYETLSSYPLSDLSEESLTFLQSNTKGDILGRYFNDSGFIPAIPEQGHDLYFSGIPQEDLEATKNRICICCGTQKTKTIISAAGIDAFDTLITDIKTATEVLDILGGKS